MLVIYAVLVPYMSSYKGEFMFLGTVQLHMCLTALALHFAGNLVHVL